MLAKKNRAKPRVTSEKLTVSFRRGMVAKAKKSARRFAGGNVSAYVEEALADRMRHEALGDAIAYYESKNGKISEEALAAADAKWPKEG
jgi:CRISPR/Cas system CMR-associated protein Cmr5 small subunit